jgi:hypothetical protein
MALMATKNQQLEVEVESARRTIASDGYPMSIGELTSLYRDGELIIRPEFQRLFRWSPTQKSRLVESILLGIPLPSIFVSQTKDGKWELVDGLQRVSTILQLQNELRNAEGKKAEALVLEETKYLPDLEGRQWEHEDEGKAIPKALKLDIKRAKIDIKILKRESSKETKFDLFQRLNSFGSTLTPQEVRSALLVGASTDCFAWMQQLARCEAFAETVLLSDSDMDVQYDLELVLRFLVLHRKPEAELSVSALKDFSQVLDTESVEIAERYPKGANKLEETFTTTFEIISKNGGAALFTRWDKKAETFRGSFLNSAYEIFALGVGFHVASGTPFRKDLISAAKKLWTDPQMAKGFATGKSTEKRLSLFVPLGRELLSK